MPSRVDKSSVVLGAPVLRENDLLSALENEDLYELNEIEDLDQLRQQILQESCDLVLVSSAFTRGRLAEIVQAVHSVREQLPVMVLTDHDDERTKGELWASGVNDCIAPPVTPEELCHRVRLLTYNHRLTRRNEELSRENRQLWELAVTDGLTKLLNRRHFMERMEHEFLRVKRFGGGLGCIIADIDHFKRVNDTYGHLVGDRILRTVAEQLRSSVRTIDTVGRYGGEEFVLLMPETVGDGLGFAAEKLRKIIAETNFSDPDDPEGPGPEHLTLSFGYADYPRKQVDTHTELINIADKALYRAKQNGRNRCEAG